jgi:hypothetical protein
LKLILWAVEKGMRITKAYDRNTSYQINNQLISVYLPETIKNDIATKPVGKSCKQINVVSCWELPF